MKETRAAMREALKLEVVADGSQFIAIDEGVFDGHDLLPLCRSYVECSRCYSPRRVG